jgi:hypothetical protein
MLFWEDLLQKVLRNSVIIGEQHSYDDPRLGSTSFPSNSSFSFVTPHYFVIDYFLCLEGICCFGVLFLEGAIWSELLHGRFWCLTYHFGGILLQRTLSSYSFGVGVGASFS